jgi:hypothetical protein
MDGQNRIQDEGDHITFQRVGHYKQHLETEFEGFCKTGGKKPLKTLPGIDRKLAPLLKYHTFLK